MQCTFCGEDRTTYVISFFEMCPSCAAKATLIYKREWAGMNTYEQRAYLVIDGDEHYAWTSPGKGQRRIMDAFQRTLSLIARA
jgi:hypothetical protein